MWFWLVEYAGQSRRGVHVVHVSLATHLIKWVVSLIIAHLQRMPRCAAAAHATAADDADDAADDDDDDDGDDDDDDDNYWW